MRPIWFLVLVPPSLCFPWWSTGPTGFTFMKLGIGARPMGMAGAWTAVADDANALFYNPAGIALYPDLAATLCLMKLFRTVSYTSAGLVGPVGSHFGAGIGGAYLSATDERRDEHGEEQGTFGFSDFMFGPTLGWRPLPKLGIGVSPKYVASRIDSFSAYALSFDAGLLYRPVKIFSVGASLLHLGPPRRFIEEWEYPPVNLRSGLALKLPLDRNHILAASDLSLYPDLAPTVSVGAELYLYLGRSQTQTTESGLYLRGGYQTGSQLGIWSGFTFGIGYEYLIANRLFLSIDAVYVSYGLLGDAERLSLSFRFAPARVPRPPDRIGR
ncbi:MAG: PorV/PorQ family protein [candidate division WOR-3 bacterium]